MFIDHQRLFYIAYCPADLFSRLTRPSYEALKLAVWKQDLQKIQQLISESCPTHQNSQSILHYATIENKAESVEFFAENYTELINEKNEEGDTSLMLALFGGNQKIVRCLLPLSNQNIKDNNGNTAFVIAAANGNIPILQEMLSSSCNNTLVRNFEGQTALHRASYYGELETVKLLLKKTSLRISQTDRSNNTALHMACMSCHLVCAKYLIKKMKDATFLLQAKNKQDKTAADILKEMLTKLNSYKKSEKNAVDVQAAVKYVFGPDSKKHKQN